MSCSPTGDEAEAENSTTDDDDDDEAPDTDNTPETTSPTGSTLALSALWLSTREFTTGA